MFVPACNMTDTPVVIDEEGRTLGGGEWGVVDRFDPAAQAAIEVSRLRIFPELEDGAAYLNEGANDAVAEAAELERRRREVDGLDADVVAYIAAQTRPADAVETLAATDDGPGQLRRMLVRGSDVLPSAPDYVPPPAPGPEPLDEAAAAEVAAELADQEPPPPKVPGQAKAKATNTGQAKGADK